VTDLMREAFTACGADAAIINAGTLRLNHDLPKGTTITPRHVEELMPFTTPLFLVELSGEQIRRALENAISRPGTGRWLQVSGLAFVHDPAPPSPRVSKLFLSPSGGRPAVDLMQHPEQRVRVVVNEYIIREPREGFVGILPPVAQALPCAASGSDLKALILSTLTARGSIAPTAEGRICAAADTAKRECQADLWARPAAR
jgi:5'-nucleotidase